MTKKSASKKVVAIIVLLAIAATSVLVISRVASSSGFHASTIQTLDNKKAKIVGLTAAAAGMATLLAFIPDDSTTPVANQILELSSYLLIVIGAIFLEKILLTLTGYIAFSFLIPAACLLCIAYICFKKRALIRIAAKLAICAIVICLVVPVSVKISALIEATQQETINQTLNAAKDAQSSADESAKESSDDGSGLDGVVSAIQDGISSIGESVSGWLNKGKKYISNFMDTIAVFIITSCVIPIAVLLSFVWIVKAIFGINIPISKFKKPKFNKVFKNADDNEKQSLPQ